MRTRYFGSISPVLVSRSALAVLLYALLSGCMAAGVESQRAPGTGNPMNPWGSPQTPYLDPDNTYSGTGNGSGSNTNPGNVTLPANPGATPPQNGNTFTDSCYKADAFTCAVERLIFDKTNAYRSQRGLRPLKFGWRLGYAARDWSIQQASRGGISHAGFPGARMRFLVNEFGSYRGLDVSAENVAYTGYSSGSVEAIASEFAEMWWGSSGHRRNMLGNHEYLGVGVHRDGRRWFATQIFGEE